MPANTLETALVHKFNEVSPKVVKVDDLMTVFGALEEKRHFNIVDRGMAQAEINTLVQNAAASGGAGIYGEKGPDGKPVLYVDSHFVTDNLLKIAKDGQLPGIVQAATLNVDAAAADALQICQDQSGKVKSGKIQPLQPKR